MRKFFCVLVSALIIMISAACSREWRDPDTALPAQNVSIASLLANPDAFDMSGVIVIGKIWRPRVESMGPNENGAEDVYTVFTLADRQGIGIDVYVNGRPLSPTAIISGSSVSTGKSFRHREITSTAG